ncbi:adhesin [Salmonella enterica]|nr:adhesin [Salmonella enterica]EHG3238387.1 adhesin [Salmonella enterica]EHR7011387.1 adhesin [Salmonella enterica]
MKSDISSLKKSLAAVLFTCTVAGSAAAADKQEITISLEATVPSDRFHVLPLDTSWMSQPQEMGYDVVTGTLRMFKKTFNYKNTGGAIRASLTGGLNSNGAPQLSNGTDAIPLKVTFNRIELSGTGATVVKEDAAKAGGQADLEITQLTQSGKSPATLSGGKYTGSVSVLFEPELAATKST